MSIARTLVWILIFTISALLVGCSRAPEQNIEEQESESLRNERRQMHQKLAPDAKPMDPETQKQ